MEDKKVWNVIKNGKIVKVTFPDDQPQPVKEEKELDWFRLYQPKKRVCMNRNDIDFESWFDMLQTTLSDDGITFLDADSVRDDYYNDKDVYDVADEIKAEYAD